MNPSVERQALITATHAARAAGELMRGQLRATKRVHSATQHDIKLELDVRCQQRIEKTLCRDFPKFAILGEEGVRGEAAAAYRWVVDPIDGTVNFTYGIPHACVSIALQRRTTAGARAPSARPGAAPDSAYQTTLGVVYDPFRDELWTAIRGEPARLNGKVIRVSRRRRLAEAIVSIGFAKTKDALEKMLPAFTDLIHRVRKVRIMGSAALDLVYVATGRMDAYTEHGVRLWDIAAGGLILECAGGDFWHQPSDGGNAYRLIANNGFLRRRLQRVG